MTEGIPFVDDHHGIDVLVHDRAAELKFVADGWAVGRHDLMYNDFIVVAPGPIPQGLPAAATPWPPSAR